MYVYLYVYKCTHMHMCNYMCMDVRDNVCVHVLYMHMYTFFTDQHMHMCLPMYINVHDVYTVNTLITILILLNRRQLEMTYRTPAMHNYLFPSMLLMHWLQFLLILFRNCGIFRHCL